jgi:hypothetical protein
MRRLSAVVGALLMVILALVVRGQLNDDGGDGSSGDGGGEEPVALLCAEELADVCASLEADGVATVTVEPVGVTVDRLGVPDAELDADAWLTLAPFPQIVDERREADLGNALFGEVEATGYSSGLATVAFDDRFIALDEDCDEVGWSCLGDIAGDPWSEHQGESSWGAVKPGYDRPDTSATGLLVLTQAMADHLGVTSFAGQDIDNRWLGDLEDAVPTRTAGTALEVLLQQGPSAFAAVGALGVDADGAADSARGDDLTIFYPAPMYRAEVVVAGGADLEGLDDALAEAGWEQGGDGEPLPPAGVLDALRVAWEEAA